MAILRVPSGTCCSFFSGFFSPAVRDDTCVHPLYGAVHKIPVVTLSVTCCVRASALSAGSSHTQINIDLPVFESRRPVTASQRMRMAAAEGRQFVFFLTSLNVNNHVLSGVRYTLGAQGPIRINFL